MTNREETTGSQLKTIATTRLRVGLANFGGCEGCAIAFLRAVPKLRGMCEEIYCSYLGKEVGEEELDILFISGSICRQDEATVAHIRELRDRARIVVALGSCTALGGVMRFARGGQEPKPEHSSYLALPVLIPVDYSLPGCPPLPAAVSSLVSHIQRGNEKGLELFANLAKLTKLSGFDLIDDVVLYGLCIGCGACELSCPTRAIRMVDGKPDLSPEKCIRCGTCYVRCPVGRQNIVQRRVLRELDERLQEVSKSYMELLGFVSHELKNPLASAIMGLYTVKDGHLGELTPQQKKALEAVAKSLDYFQDLVRKYLDLSRVEQGTLQVRKAPVRLREEVIDPALEALGRELEERGMEVEVHVPADLVMHADRDLLRIVYDNLLSNTVKYGNEGGRIVLEAEEGPEEVILSVWNEGPGIPQEKLPYLFRKFSRIDLPAHAKRRGTGLGLFICKEIVERHGGRIWAESEPEKWARFSFTLPKEKEEG
ncbi:ATP-binding protein [Candidatus Bipolaricaulota bacterium]|nr:ATP-binding protein [Candidatus Bipolaricaulota bacterium]